MWLAVRMAHDDTNNGEGQHNPIVEMRLQLPMAVAGRWVAQPQYVISERMMGELMDVLTEEQMAELIRRKVEFQPVVFPNEAVVL